MKRIIGLAKAVRRRGGRMLLRLLCFVLLLARLAPASGQEVTSVFVSPSSPLVAGSRASLWLWCMNNSSNEVTQTFERTVDCRIISGSGTLTTVLSLNSTNSRTEAVISPGGFAKQEYLLDVPPTIRGQVVLQVGKLNQLVVQVEGGSSQAPVATSVPPSPAPRTPLVTDVLHHFSPYLSPYEPIYFLLGSQPAAEFQVSLKYQLLSVPNPPRWMPVNELYLAYTQTSFWSLLSTNPAFYDTSYKPSMFLYFPDVLGADDNTPIRVDLQSGYEHESNGHGNSPDERSLNTLYLQPTVTFGRTNELQLALQPRAWVYIFGLEHNPNLPDYRGYADLLSTLTWKECQVAAKFRIGDEGDHSSLQLDFRYRLPRCFHFNPTIQAQYFTGYGETLRHYNQINRGIRVGLSIYDTIPIDD